MYFGRPETGLININLPFLLEIRLHIPQSEDVYMAGRSCLCKWIILAVTTLRSRWKQRNILLLSVALPLVMSFESNYYKLQLLVLYIILKCNGLSMNIGKQTKI